MKHTEIKSLIEDNKKLIIGMAVGSGITIAIGMVGIGVSKKIRWANTPSLDGYMEFIANELNVPYDLVAKVMDVDGVLYRGYCKLREKG